MPNSLISTTKRLLPEPATISRSPSSSSCVIIGELEEGNSFEIEEEQFTGEDYIYKLSNPNCSLVYKTNNRLTKNTFDVVVEGSIKLEAYDISTLDSLKGFPCSAVIKRAKSS